MPYETPTRGEAGGTGLASSSINNDTQCLRLNYGWYQELVTDLPPIENGQIRAPEGPGLGTRLLPEVKRRPDARVRRSAAAA